MIEGVFVGSELLDNRVNTHESFSGARLRSRGLRLRRATTVPDDRDLIAGALAESLSRCDAVLVCGGLGPTFDDVTREGAAAALGRGLRFDRALWAEIERRFSRRAMPIPEENKRQAFLIEGATALRNTVGSAPGQLIERLRVGRPPQTLALLPGPLAELEPMFDRQVLPRLARAYARDRSTEQAVFRLSGIAESVADEKLAGITRKPGEGEEFTILSGNGQVDFFVTVTDSSRKRARQRLKGLRRRVLDAVGEDLFGEGNCTLESALAEALRRRRWTLAVAESCTGGLVGQRLTSAPGSSRYFLGGVIAYDNAVKSALLGVPRGMLERHGAVSAACARAMAQGARRATGATLGLSITGIAGPEGGTLAKPVGLVFVALAGPGSRDNACVKLSLGTGRQAVRQRAAAAALDLALRHCGKFVVE